MMNAIVFSNKQRKASNRNRAEVTTNPQVQEVEYSWGEASQADSRRLRPVSENSNRPARNWTNSTGYTTPRIIGR